MEAVQGINSNIRTMYNLLEKLEETYCEKLSSSEQRKILDIKTDIKLKQLIKLQMSQDKITINADGRLFQTSKDSFLNCRYRNILKDVLIKNEYTPQPEYDIFLDIEADYFEALIQIIRLSPVQNEGTSELKKLENNMECFGKNNPASKKPKYPLEVQRTEFNHRPGHHLKEKVKKFFYADWEEIIKEYQIIE